MMTDYELPVARLPELGEDTLDSPWKPWLDYRQEPGLNEAHIPVLIRMMADPALLNISPQDDKFYAPVHAMRALAQLKADASIPQIIRMFHEQARHEWFWDEYPYVFASIGPAAIPPLRDYLADGSRDEFHRSHAIPSISRIAQTYPETREACIAILTRQLEQFQDNGYDNNATLIGELTRLQARDTLPLIEQAYAADMVDDFYISLEDVHIGMGEKKARARPMSLTNMVDPSRLSKPSRKKATAKKKKKRKSAKQLCKSSRKK